MTVTDKKVIARRADACDPRDGVPQLEQFMTVGQLAEHWQLHSRTIRRMIANGQIPVQRFGRTVRISRNVVAKLDSQGIV
jgi:excisionase family DNA binding protein